MLAGTGGGGGGEGGEAYYRKERFCVRDLRGRGEGDSFCGTLYSVELVITAGLR